MAFFSKKGEKKWWESAAEFTEHTVGTHVRDLPAAKAHQQTIRPLPHHGDHGGQPPIPIDRLLPGFDVLAGHHQGSLLSSALEKKRRSIDSGAAIPTRASLDNSALAPSTTSSAIPTSVKASPTSSSKLCPALAMWDAATHTKPPPPAPSRIRASMDSKLAHWHHDPEQSSHSLPSSSTMGPASKLLQKGGREGSLPLIPTNLVPLEMREPPPDYAAIRLRETLGVTSGSDSASSSPHRGSAAGSVRSSFFEPEYNHEEAAGSMEHALQQGFGAQPPWPPPKDAESAPPPELRSESSTGSYVGQVIVKSRRHTVSVGDSVISAPHYMFHQQSKLERKCRVFDSSHGSPVTRAGNLMLSRTRDSNSPLSRMPPSISERDLPALPVRRRSLDEHPAPESPARATLGRRRAHSLDEKQLEEHHHHGGGSPLLPRLHHQQHTLAGPRRRELSEVGERFDSGSERDQRAQADALLAQWKTRNTAV